MQRFFVALLTAVVFLAGYGTRLVTERGHHIPPPPAALANEYANVTPVAEDGDKQTAERAKERAKLVAEIEKVRPQIEAYRAQIDDVYAEFDREFIQILTPSQREKHVSNQKKWAEHEAKKKANAGPLSDDDINRARQRALTDVYWMVTVTPRLEGLTKEYELDANQQASVRALLTLRRNKFMAILDATPHLSVRLSKLAPMLERVAAPVK
jgi:hypothetical protein